MRKIFWRKELVIIIIILVVGAIILPNISGDINDKEINKKNTSVLDNIPEDVINNIEIVGKTNDEQYNKMKEPIGNLDLYANSNNINNIQRDRGIILYVGGSGPGNYSKIQDAINNASTGDTIFVYNGTYYENLNIDKTINLTGEERDITIIDGGGIGDVVYLTSDNNIVSNFTIINGQIGIHLYGCENAHVDNCHLSGNDFGIDINYYSFNNNISNCQIQNSADRGISIGSSNTEDNNFYNNTLEITNEVGFYFYAPGSFKNSIDASNTVNGCPIVFVTYEVDITVDGIDAIVQPFEDIQVTNFGLIIAYECFNVTISNCTATNHVNDGVYIGGDNTNLLIRDCTVQDNDIGIHLYGCENAHVDNCHLSGNDFGIDINYYSFNNNISNCQIQNSADRGISIGPSNTEKNVVTGCFISSNNRGIHIITSNILLYNNYFSNLDNVYDNGNNQWNISKTPGNNIVGGPYLGGNFWNDYTGNDTDGDGLGDTNLPYNSSGNILNGGDWNPLVKIDNEPPIANFTFEPEIASTNTVVQFNDSCTDSDGNIVSWLWNFGDNYLSTEKNPIHQYYIPGIYNITLIVTDDEGGTDSISKTITVTLFNGYITELDYRWNLMSIPFNETLHKNNIIVSYNGTDYSWQQAVDSGVLLGFIYRWNTTSQTYEAVNILNPGEGYWMWAYFECKLLQDLY